MTDIPENPHDRTAPPASADPLHPENAEDSGTSRDGWRATPHWYVAEIIVVVVGVIIALAANAWWEGRGEGKLEAEILRAARQELEENRELLTRFLAATDSCLDRTERFLRASPATWREVTPDSGFHWISALSCRQTFDPTLSVAETLSEAPALNTVEDIRVRTAVAAWVTSLADAGEERDALTKWGEAVYDAFRPYAVDHAEGGFPPFPTLPRIVARGAPEVLAELRAAEEVMSAVFLKAHYQKAY